MMEITTQEVEFTAVKPVRYAVQAKRPHSGINQDFPARSCGRIASLDGI